MAISFFNRLNTPIFGIKLYILAGVFFIFAIVISVLTYLCLCSSSKRMRYRKRVNADTHQKMHQKVESLPIVGKESIDRMDDSRVEVIGKFRLGQELGIEIEGKEKKKNESSYSGSNKSVGSQSEVSIYSGDGGGGGGGGVNNVGWGRWYSFKELEMATNFFCQNHVVGEGGYGIVYKGILQDGSVIAVKDLLNNKGQAEKEFKVEVEAIGKVRHKNLVGLLGFCAEGAQRLLVYEYVDNGNLEQWLHGDLGPVSLLTWETRMNIAIGTAKGLAYLHEGLEPKVVHRDVKSSNILLDSKWNAKVSDFGLAKLLGPEKSYVTTRVMGTFGYVSPEYASTGMLNEGSDVYSFGVLLMEIITGRCPVDYTRPQGEMNLVEWFRGMVASHRGEEAVDNRIKVQPPARALKRLLLICLRCTDMDASKRPKMGQIVHMLEADEFPFRSEARKMRETAARHPRVELSEKCGFKDGDVRGSIER
ncbi:probable receptor-like serine/threonine-protein kinase At4g34500 [Impatiens glandulifera]|uniref:probable receptor-like serine/threonine-protein kinase At4g34500 n=1 Tax=Impatiens glandulifera TaxID=253017 RepID=UPI001FB11CA0|nr:probable receptor-like serine/threonine-protein kinase At4g34500 [Impatiens glandulifera]